MKPEEAIEVLNEILDVLGLSHCSNSSEYIAVDTAIQSLEKQIPKKPKMYVGEYDFERYPLCASCGGELIPRGEKLCPCCGQKIEWED